MRVFSQNYNCQQKKKMKIEWCVEREETQKNSEFQMGKKNKTKNKNKKGGLHVKAWLNLYIILWGNANLVLSVSGKSQNLGHRWSLNVPPCLIQGCLLHLWLHVILIHMYQPGTLHSLIYLLNTDFPAGNINAYNQSCII